MAKAPVEVRKTVPAPAGPESWRSLRTEMDRVFDRFFDGWMPSLRGLLDAAPFRFDTPLNMPTPAIDVTEDDKAFKVSAELPGIAETDIEVALMDGMLTIKGEKKLEKEEKDKNYYLSERSYGSFRRSFELPEGIDRDHVAADFSKGVLTVTLPKTEETVAAAKKIEVKAAA